MARIDGLWPNQPQDLLLSAIAAPDAAAVDAFLTWCGQVAGEADFDNGTRRLLPMVYHRMQQLGVAAPIMGRLKGTYRRAWYDTNAVLHATAPVVALLETHNIDTLLLKGVPLILSWYGKPALRPVADLDIVVRPAQARQAIALLHAAGWRPGPSARDEDLEFRHSMQFINDDGREVDIHWHCLFESCNEAADARFWDTSKPLAFGGVTTRRLNTTNTLLHGIIHGLRWNAEPPIRWIPDALTVLRAPREPIDWHGMLAFARSQRLTHRLGLGLDYLARRHAAPVPESVLAALTAARTSLTERVENTVVLRDSERMFEHPLIKQWVIFADYCRAARDRRGIDFAVGFSHYLRYRWRLRGRREILPVVLRGMWRRVPGGSR